MSQCAQQHRVVGASLGKLGKTYFGGSPKNMNARSRIGKSPDEFMHSVTPHLAFILVHLDGLGVEDIETTTHGATQNLRSLQDVTRKACTLGG